MTRELGRKGAGMVIREADSGEDGEIRGSGGALAWWTQHVGGETGSRAEFEAAMRRAIRNARNTGRDAGQAGTQVGEQGDGAGQGRGHGADGTT